MSRNGENNKGGAPKGNTNGSKENRLWANTIRRAVTQGDANKLRELADKLIENAASGDNTALKEIGDRLDGKSIQGIEANVKGKVIVNLNQYGPGNKSTE